MKMPFLSKKTAKAAGKIAAVIAATLASLFLSGCFDMREVDELAYPMALGLDVGEANELRITLQLAVPLSIGAGSSGKSGGGDGGGADKSTSIITVDTPSLYSGLNLVNNIISKEINMSHAKVIVISRRLAERGISKYLHALQRGREFKPDVFIVISNDPPDDYLRKTKPILENNPSKYYEQMLGKNFTSFFPGASLHDFYCRNESLSVEPVAVLAGLGKYENTGQLKAAGNEKKSADFIPEGEYEAGNIPVVSDEKNEVMGTAVFKNGKMCGTLNGKESACYQMITGDFNHTYWTLPDPEEKGSIIVLNIFRRKKPSVEIEMDGGIVKARIHLDIEGDYASIQSEKEYESRPEIIEHEMETMLEENILDLLKKTRDEFDSDICGIGNYVKQKFMTWNEWEKFDWPEKYKHVGFEADVVFRIRRTGLMIRTVGRPGGTS